MKTICYSQPSSEVNEFMQKKDKNETWLIISLRIPPSVSSLGNHALATAHSLAKKGKKVLLWSFTPPEKKLPHPCQFSWEPLPDILNQFEKSKLAQEIEKKDSHLKILWYYDPGHFFNLHKQLSLLIEKNSKKLELHLVFHKSLETAHEISNLLKFPSYLKERRFLKKLIGKTKTILITAPYLEGKLKKLSPSKDSPKIHWLPLQNGIHYQKDADRSRNIRKAFSPHSQFLFGSYGSFQNKQQKKQLRKVIALALREHPERSFLCIGRRSKKFVEKFQRQNPELAHQIEFTGELNTAAISAHIQACDVMIQPYPKGLNTKKMSLLTALAHGKAVLSNKGPQTEKFWEKKECLSLYDDESKLDFIKKLEDILYDSSFKKTLERRSFDFYEKVFSPGKTLEIILSL